jgi:O-antigen/teichoic acid export membrane protein
VIAADATVAFFLLLFLRPWRYISVKVVRRARAREMLSYALPLMPSAVLWWITSISDRYFLLHYHGAALMGLYAAASRIPTALTFLVGIFLEAWQYTAIGMGEERRAARYGQIWAMLLPLAVGGAAGLIAIAYPLVSVIYAPEYAGAVAFIPWLTLSALFSALSSFLSSIYVVRLKSSATLLSALCGALLNLALNFMLIPRLGGIGAALATVFSYALVFLVRVLHTRRYLSFSRHFLQLTLSVLFLLLVALCVSRGAYAIALLPAAFAPLPFLLEIWEGGSLLLQKMMNVWKKRQKKTKGY